MPVKKEDAYRALELLEEYHGRLSRPQDTQLRTAIEKVIEVFKSRLFQALIDIQEYYEVTLLDDGKTVVQKTDETNQVTNRWERPSTNNVILASPTSTTTDLEEPLPISQPGEPIISEDLYAKPIKTGPKPVQPPPEQSYKVSADAEPPAVPPKPQVAPKPKKGPKPTAVVNEAENLPLPPPEPVQTVHLSSVPPVAQQPDDDWEYEDITLKKGSSSLGISIAGGTDSPHVPNDTSIFITNVIDGGIAAADGRLRINDIILSVNGVSMVNITHAESVQVLKQAGKTVTLTVKRLKELEEEVVMEIELVKGSKGLGMSIAGGIGSQHIVGDDGIFVTKVIAGGAAHLDGRLMVGDRLIAVNDVNLENVDHEMAVATLKATKQQVKLVIGRPSYSAVDGPEVVPPSVTVAESTPKVSAKAVPADFTDDSHDVSGSITKSHTKKKKKAAAVADASGELVPPSGRRKIVLMKGQTGLGFNIVGGEDGDGIFVSFILPGGPADLSGALFKGDQLLSVNGIDLKEASHEQAAAVLKGAGERVEIRAQYKPDEYALFDARIRDLREQLMNTSNVPAVSAKVATKQSLYVRALFDYDPSTDSGATRDGFALQYGDVFHVTNSSDDEWWHVKRVLPADGVVGIIPSKQRAERIERARIKSIKAGRPEKKKKKKALNQSKEVADEEAEERVFTYEAVTKTEVNYTRPVIVFGLLKERINDDLVNEYPDQFGSCVPHTSRPPRDNEAHGRDYYFVASREQMEQDIENQLFVEAGQFNGNLYGTSVQSVKDVCNQGRHCILDVGGNAIKRLQSAGIQPIAIFLKPTSADNVIDWLGNLSEDQARKQYDRTLKLQEEFGGQFTAIVSGTSADDVYDQVKAVVNEHSGSVTWVATAQPI